MKHVKGDLIELFKQGEFDVIIHGCNCGCNMGDGIAKTIRDQFPEAFEADLATPKWSRGKLGTISFVATSLGDIVNAYTQYHWRGRGPNGPLCEYDALASAFAEVRTKYGGKGLRFGIPAIGAGRAGGDWEVISEIIDRELSDEDVTFVEFSGEDIRGNFRVNMGSKKPPIRD